MNAHPLWVAWYDDHPKRTLAEKCADASAAYAARFGAPATLLLVSPDAPDPLPDGATRAANIRPNTVWAGREG